MSCVSVITLVLVWFDVTCFTDLAHVQQHMLAAARFCYGHFCIFRGAEGHNCGVHVALRIRRTIENFVVKFFPMGILTAKFLVDLCAGGECEHENHDPCLPPLFGSCPP